MEDEFKEKLPYKIYNSTTKDHYHIIVEMPFEMDNEQRIIWQLLLGSDPVRELLSMFRILNNDPFPSLLATKEIE
jgi:hypothetical protein